MNWKYYEPKFEYENILEDLPLPWAGHKYFAYDLISNIKPKVIVELGTYYGTSLWAFSQAVKDQSNDTEINAVDTWEGDKHAGFYDEEVFETVKKIKNKFYSELKINLIRKTFDTALSDFKDNSIDVLHIDGLHTYEAIKHDFELWLPKVKDNGIILFHDIVVTRDDFGVYKFWKELKLKYETIEFNHSYGLGVMFKGSNNSVFNIKEKLELYYSYSLEDIENGKILRMLQQLNEKNQELARKEQDLILKNEEIQLKEQEIKAKSQEIQLKEQEIKAKSQEIQLKEQEIKVMKSSKFWKIRTFCFNLIRFSWKGRV